MARFIDEAVDAMDISAISDHHERELRSYPPYHPRMMLKSKVTKSQSAARELGS